MKVSNHQKSAENWAAAPIDITITDRHVIDGPSVGSVMPRYVFQIFQVRSPLMDPHDGQSTLLQFVDGESSHHYPST